MGLKVGGEYLDLSCAVCSAYRQRFPGLLRGGATAGCSKEWIGCRELEAGDQPGLHSIAGARSGGNGLGKALDVQTQCVEALLHGEGI